MMAIPGPDLAHAKRAYLAPSERGQIDSGGSQCDSALDQGIETWSSSNAGH
jgi:hypothetical protein